MSNRARDRGRLPTLFEPEALDLATLLASETRDGIAIIGADGQLAFWNSAAATITGWSSPSAAQPNLRALATASEPLVEVREGKWVEVRRSTLTADGKTFMVVLFTDSTPQVRLRDTREQLRSLGLIDRRTNLPGRELALVHIEHAIALAKRDRRSVGVLSLKLDRFRELRDQPETAAEVVRQFAKRVTAFVRTSDVPARMSDDSFLVVLTALTSSNDAAVVAVRLLLVLAEPFDVIGKARTVHCSIGVAESPRDADTAIAVLGAALSAADRAQVMGGGRYCVASETRADR